MGNFFDELKRRNVVRVAIAYVVVGWLVFQVGEIMFPTFGAPDWIFKSLILLIALGFPFALLFAWAFELTPEGIKKTREVDMSTSITPSTGKKLNRVTMALLVVALAYFIWERQAGDAVEEPAGVASSVESPTADVAEDSVADEPGPRTIAVLPFVNMSSDQEQEWFADGLTEEILNSLARTPDLLVAARTSSFAFKGSNKDITEIADSLGVAHILEGSVRRSGERLRVTAQLIRAGDGFHLWSQTYDRDFADLIDIQEDVAFAIANALETAMDPEALANMVSSGTSSVPAFEAYLQGLAYGISTLQTGDKFQFLSARDAFERAIEIDPEFAKAHWQLANFWTIQLSTTNIVAGLTDMDRDEMQALYEEAINNAILYEKDPVDQTKYRAFKANIDLKFRQALRLNAEYLEKRPLDQQGQALHLSIIGSIGSNEEIISAVRRFEAIDGHDRIVTNNSITQLTYAGDMNYLREFVRLALDHWSDDAFIHYQAHRAMLWAGDIDGAAQIMPVILASDVPEDSRYMVLLRQACAEKRVDDARKLYRRAMERFGDDYSIMWLSHKIMGDDAAAIETLSKLDNANDLTGLADFLTYGPFDPRPFPNLMALLESQGIEPREPIDVAYRCNR